MVPCGADAQLGHGDAAQALQILVADHVDGRRTGQNDGPVPEIGAADGDDGAAVDARTVQVELVRAAAVGAGRQDVGGLVQIERMHRDHRQIAAERLPGADGAGRVNVDSLVGAQVEGAEGAGARVDDQRPRRQARRQAGADVRPGLPGVGAFPDDAEIAPRRLVHDRIDVVAVERIDHERGDRVSHRQSGNVALHPGCDAKVLGDVDIVDASKGIDRHDIDGLGVRGRGSLIGDGRPAGVGLEGALQIGDGDGRDVDGTLGHGGKGCSACGILRARLPLQKRATDCPRPGHRPRCPSWRSPGCRDPRQPPSSSRR